MSEQAATVLDAEQRLLELRRVARSLYRDRDDPEVMSELVNVLGQIRGAEHALKDTTR